MSRIPVKRALVSVSDKTGLVEFCRRLTAVGVEIVSSGGTAAALAGEGIAVTLVSDVTGHPEILGGRVKTLHPRIHGGILADRSQPGHVGDLGEHGIAPFDLVVANLYPFAATVARPDVTKAEIIEEIDIGGPAMVRAAAKNHAHVGVVTSPDQYPAVVEAIETGGLDAALRRDLARTAFFLTASYDAAIVGWLEDDPLPQRSVLALERVEALRYGENPHQEGGRYRVAGAGGWWDTVQQLGGMALSYLNFFDVDAAWSLAHRLGEEPTVAIIKHANPCGVAVAADLATAYRNAFACDERSAFGGIVAASTVIDLDTVEVIEAAAQADVIIAPGYAAGVVERISARRANTRILTASPPGESRLAYRELGGGWLVQRAAHFANRPSDWRVVSARQPTEAEWADAVFAWRVCAHVSSNAIVLAKDRVAWGIGAGQQNRVESTSIATGKAAGRATGGACASDAFFPFPDGVEAAVESGVSVIVQPGGAMRDADVIAAADRFGVGMILTGERQFRH